MGLAFVIESFKFWRLKSEKTVRSLFIAAFVISFLSLVLPLGDRDFTRVTQWLISFSQNRLPQSGSLIPTAQASILSVGNLVYLGFSFLFTLLSLAISLLYASAMNTSFDDYPMHKGIRQFITAVPRLALFALMMVPPFILSLFLMGIPFIFLATQLALTPMFLIDRRWTLAKALDESLEATRGIRIQMAFAYLFVMFVLGGPRDLIMAMVPQNPISRGLIVAFFGAVQALVVGRLYALFYLYYTRSYPSRRLSHAFGPHDPSTFFAEVNRRGAEEEKNSENPSDDDSLY